MGTKNIKQTTSELRDILFDELKSLRKGTSTNDRANSVSKLASQIIYASRLELENKRMEIAIGAAFGQMRWAEVDGKTINVPALRM